jgi:ankyrin repeat protein
LAASQNGHVAIVKALLEADAAVNQAETDGCTPLYIASQEGHVAIVKALIEADAAVNQAHTDGRTPLLAASHIKWCPSICMGLIHSSICF